MDWLRCNVCYRPMKKSRKTFSLTQCGHVYCSQCMTKVTTKCPECETENVTTMPLPYPPKLETMHNYFAGLDDFLEICVKTEEFQYNQWCIVMRGFEGIETKYENMKLSYWKGMEQIKSLTQAFQKLQSENSALEAERKSLLMLLEAQKIQKARRTELSFSGLIQGSQLQRVREFFPMSDISEESRTSSLPNFHEERQSNSSSVPAPRYSPAALYSDNSMIRTPAAAYNPRTPCTNHHLRSIDSGVSSVPGSLSSHAGVFRVPSAQRVPKSAASLMKRAQSSSRLTSANTGFNS